MSAVNPLCPARQTAKASTMIQHADAGTDLANRPGIAQETEEDRFYPAEPGTSLMVFDGACPEVLVAPRRRFRRGTARLSGSRLAAAGGSRYACVPDE